MATSGPDRDTAATDRVHFETLISDTSALVMSGEPDQVEAAIDTALEAVRAFFEADRSALLEVSTDRQRAHVQFASYGEGIPPVSGEINLADVFPWARYKLLIEQAPVIVYRLEDLPPEAAQDRRVWEQMATRSNLAVPVFVGPSVTHIIVIHWVHQERRFPDAYVPRLRVLGDVLVSALQRKQAFEALRISEERLERSAAAGGCGLWELDWPTGSIWVTSETRRLYGLSASEQPTWERFIGLLHREDRDRVVAGAAAVMAGNGLLDERHRIVRDDGAERWMQVTARRNSATRLVGASLDDTDRRTREDQLRAALDEVRMLRDRLQQENLYLRQETERRFGAKEVAGHSAAIRRALSMAEQVAPTNATVLLTGETGTGKERFATLIHEGSPRRARAMVRVNCAAIPTALIESELFGREKGAFTGAMAKAIGRFELADGSTIFLDEVGDLPLEVQVKLLRVLEEHTLERLGSSKSIEIDVRIVAATNRDLAQAVDEGSFRADLYYRLNVFPIVLPPLRDRREDIPAIVTSLIEDISAAMGKRFDTVARSSLEALIRHDWPGNVRELRNVLERAMILSPGPTLHVDTSGLGPPAPRPEPAGSPGGHLEDVERDHILRVLADTGWRIKGPGSASFRLGLKPSTLYFRMKKLGIARPS